MRLGVIACQVLTRELSVAAAQSPSSCCLHWLPQGLHDSPDLLRKTLQHRIERLEQDELCIPIERKLNAIVLGFGLCGGALEGIHAGRLPLVLPRSDDCIPLLLGGRERYQTYLEKGEGIYWLSSGWLEYANLPEQTYYTRKLSEYAMLYGAENARWLLDEENAWISHYGSCIHILSPVADFPEQEACARRIANDHGWKFVQSQGDNQLLTALLQGAWDEKKFLICPPGYQIARSFSGELFSAVLPDEKENEIK